MMDADLLLGLNGLAIALLMAVALLLFWFVLRAWHGALPGWAPSPRQAALFGVPALLLLGLAAPVSGWLVLDQRGIPLGLTWVLCSSLLYLLAGIAWLLASRRLLVLHAGPAELAAPRGRFLGFSLGYAALGLTLLLVILGLILVRPA